MCWCVRLIRGQLSWLVFVNLTQTQTIFKERETQLNTYFHQNNYRQICREFSWLIMKVGRPSSLWIVPPLGRQSCVIQESRPSKSSSKQYSSMSFVLLPASKFLLWLPTMNCDRVYINQTNLYFLNCFWSAFLSQEYKANSYIHLIHVSV